MTISKKTKTKQSVQKNHKHDDPYFAQWMETLLPTLGLKVIKKLKLGILPLEADLIVVRREQGNLKWKKHSLWKHLAQHVLIEFKSAGDPAKRGDLEKLISYTGLYFNKADLNYDIDLHSWLIVPELNKQLRLSMGKHHIKLEPILAGFWKTETFYPLYVVEFNHLPVESPYSDLKLFMKGGVDLKNSMRLALKRLAVEGLVDEFVNIATEIHEKETVEVLEMAVKENPKLYEIYDKVLMKVGPEKSKTFQEGKAEGEAEGIKRTLVLQAKTKFIQIPKAIVSKINAIHNVNKLEKLATDLLTVNSLEEFKKLLK